MIVLKAKQSLLTMQYSVITNSPKSPLLLLYPKLSSLRNDYSINLNLSDHVCVFAETYDDRRLQNIERINVLCVMISLDMNEIRGKEYSITILDL